MREGEGGREKMGGGRKTGWRVVSETRNGRRGA